MTEIQPSAPVGCRAKTYKREFAVGTFFACLAWAIVSKDTTFLEITFMPTLFNAGVALGLHEYSENMTKKPDHRNPAKISTKFEGSD